MLYFAPNEKLKEFNQLGAQAPLNANVSRWKINSTTNLGGGLCRPYLAVIQNMAMRSKVVGLFTLPAFMPNAGRSVLQRPIKKSVRDMLPF